MSFPHAGHYVEAILDPDGALLKNNPVWVYQVGTTIPNTIYSDKNRTSTVTQPLSTSVIGDLVFFADPGDYDLALVISGVVQASLTITVEPDPLDIASETDSDMNGNVWEGPGAAASLTPNIPFSPHGGGNTAVGYQALQNTATGFWNVAMGYQAFPFSSTVPSRDPARCVAIGAFANITDLGSGTSWGTAVGDSATAAEWGTAIGAGAVTAEGALALGYQADASNGGICIGNGRSVLNGISMGHGSPEAIGGQGHIVIGNTAFIDADYDCLALGTLSAVVGGVSVVQSIAIGVFAFVNGAANAIAMGWQATVSGDRAIAIGYNTVASGEDSVAFGSNAVSNVDNQIVLGSSSHTTKIPGLGAFVSGDKYLVVDSNGVLHKSALGPAS